MHKKWQTNKSICSYSMLIKTLLIKLFGKLKVLMLDLLEYFKTKIVYIMYIFVFTAEAKTFCAKHIN